MSYGVYVGIAVAITLIGFVIRGAMYWSHEEKVRQIVEETNIPKTEEEDKKEEKAEEEKDGRDGRFFISFDNAKEKLVRDRSFTKEELKPVFLNGKSQIKGQDPITRKSVIICDDVDIEEFESGHDEYDSDKLREKLKEFFEKMKKEEE